MLYTSCIHGYDQAYDSNIEHEGQNLTPTFENKTLLIAIHSVMRKDAVVAARELYSGLAILRGLRAWPVLSPARALVLCLRGADPLRNMHSWRFRRANPGRPKAWPLPLRYSCGQSNLGW